MTNIFTSLNKEQAEAVKQIAGPILILAGAGSGKTKALTCRIAYLLEQKVRPYNILAITFTNKAAKEMRQRVDKLVGENAKDVWLFTFHGFCSRILRREIGNLPGYSSSFTIYDPTDCKNVLKDVLKKLNMDEKFYPINMLISTISNAKNAMVDAGTFAKRADNFHGEKVAEIYAEYEKALLHNNAVDFDDLLLLVLQVFETHPEVLAKYQQKFTYVLIDEYQDTNHVQYMLAKLLCEKSHNLCVVGDIDQSIYGWRGADISNILDFEQDYPEAKIVKLEQNYRSTQVILDAANAVIENNVERKPKKLWTDNGNGTLIEYYHARDDRDEADFTVHQVMALQNRGQSLGNIAILYRTNAQSRMFEEMLIKAGLPYVMVGGLKFYERKEIKDVLGYLRALFNNQDDQAIMRIINVPKRGIGTAGFAKLQQLALAANCSVLALAKDPVKLGALGRTAAKIGVFGQVMQELAGLVDTVSVKDLIDAVIRKTGYLEELEVSRDPQAESRKGNIYELMRIAEEFGQDETEEHTLEAFLNHVSLVADIDDAKLETEKVTLMTLHSSKGLEFPVVFLAGMEEGMFPSQRSLDSEEGIEEERRLCYVGITRAKEKLYLTSCASRMLYGHIVMFPPSRFLQEIPRNLITAESYQDARGSAGQSAGYGSGNQTGYNSGYDNGNRAGSGYNGRRSTGYDDSYNNNAGRGAKPRHIGSVFSAAVQSGKFVPEGDRPLTVLKPGDRVSHKKWGIGTVVSAKPEEEGQEVKVAFPNQGIRLLLTKYRILEKI